MGLRLDFSYTYFKDKKNPAKVKMFDSFEIIFWEMKVGRTAIFWNLILNKIKKWFKRTLFPQLNKK